MQCKSTIIFLFTKYNIYIFIYLYTIYSVIVIPVNSVIINLTNRFVSDSVLLFSVVYNQPKSVVYLFIIN